MSQIRMESCPNCNTSINELLFEPRSESDVRFCRSCQHPLLLVAGKYLLEAQIAKGGFGIIYKARHIRLQMDASRVIKFILPEIFRRASVAERFAREVQITSSLSQRNEHIVRIFDDFGEVPKIGHYYVMEHLVGTTLAERVGTRGPLPLHEALWVFRQLCAALIAAHQAQVVHRDLKPENIFLISRGGTDLFVKVIDFGIAKPVEGDGQNLTRGAIGTPEYMPPEQCVTADIDHRADIYAMGVIFYEMIAGHTPFRLPHETEPRNAMHILAMKLSSEPYSLVQHRPDLGLSQVFDAFLLKVMAKSPQARFQSVQEMLQTLQELERHNAFLASGAPLESPHLFTSHPSAFHVPSAALAPISIGQAASSALSESHLPTGELSSGTGNFPQSQPVPSNSSVLPNLSASSSLSNPPPPSASSSLSNPPSPSASSALANRPSPSASSSDRSSAPPPQSVATAQASPQQPSVQQPSVQQPSLQEDLFVSASSASRAVDSSDLRGRRGDEDEDVGNTGPSRLVMLFVAVGVVLLGILGGQMIFGPLKTTTPSRGSRDPELSAQRPEPSRAVLPREIAPLRKEPIPPPDALAVRVVPMARRDADPPVVGVPPRPRVRLRKRPIVRRMVPRRPAPSIPIVSDAGSRCPTDGHTWMQIDVSGGSFRLNKDYSFITKSSRYLCVKSPEGLNRPFVLVGDGEDLAPCGIKLHAFRKRWQVKLIKASDGLDPAPDYCLRR
ncbi:protein kinase [Myxococcota bacterium]|nr:protein kinase [Myxococcota bacterium]